MYPLSLVASAAKVALILLTTDALIPLTTVVPTERSLCLGEEKADT